MNKKTEQLLVEARRPHYYGNLIRQHFFFAALLIMIAVLLDNELRSAYLSSGLLVVIGLIILGGLTSRSNRLIVLIDVLTSTALFVIFEYFAIASFARYETFSDPIFFLRQLIAIIFLITLYYSTKTMRYREDLGDK